MAIGMVPGALVLLALRVRPVLTLFQVVGLGAGVSFASMQLLTIAAMVFQFSAVTSLWIVALLTVACTTVILVRGREVRVEVPREELALGLGFAILSVFLYAEGAPYNGVEDNVHVGIVRRLAFLQAPAINNIYSVPDVVYTYPYPGTHYVMALMARLSGLDALFVYHKLRVLWGPWALILIYGLAWRIFCSRPIAFASAATALVLVLNGGFANVKNFFWAQVVPYSHASDVAMGVMLPALIWLAFEYLLADTRRATVIFFVCVLALEFMLDIVHIRETVQFLVYFGSFSAALIVVRRHPVMRNRALVLVAVSVAMMLAYGTWHSSHVSSIDRLVVDMKQGLVTVAATSTWGQLLGPPLPLLNGYVTAVGPMFYMWNPVVLLLSPLVLVWFRRQPLVLLIGASTLVYLLIIRFPLFAIPYVYATYFEILYTPVRNMIQFIHILTGVIVFVLAVFAARLPLLAGLLASAVGAGALATAVRYVGPYFERHPDHFYLPLIVAYVLAAAYIVWRRAEAEPASPPPPRWALMLAVALVVLAFAAPAHQTPLKPAQSYPTPAVLFDKGVPCIGRHDVENTIKPPEMSGDKVMIGELLSCPPPPPLMAFAESHIPASAVFGVDKYFEYPAPMFMPQQVTVWSSPVTIFRDEHLLFPKYYDHYYRSFRKYRAQPFFNTVETDQERSSYLSDLGVTHILLNPRVYAAMKGVLDAHPGQYRVLYDQQEWAIYQVSALE